MMKHIYMFINWFHCIDILSTGDLSEIPTASISLSFFPSKVEKFGHCFKLSLSPITGKN